MKRRVLVVTAAFVAAVAVYAVLARPPRRLALRGAPPPAVLAGVLHVHSSRSDGRGTPADIAAAAKAAGLAFVILSDHGDGTRKPDPPAYLDGVLVLDGVEISTAGGHYIAVGQGQAPYPLGGEARDVVEDVRRLGGFGIAAHPDSPKPELRWQAWGAPFDAIELINLDTSWRVPFHEPGWRSKRRLFEALLTYPLRGPETIASLSRDSEEVEERWQSLTQERRVVALAGSDAHARIALGDLEPGDDRFAVPFPAYQSVFRTLSVRVRLESPPTGDAAADARALLQALRAGHVHMVVDAVASPASFAFTAASGGVTVGEGDELMPDGPIALRVRSNAPPGFTTRIIRGDRVVAEGGGGEIDYGTDGAPAVYRAEIRATDRPGAPLWIASNPIYVRPSSTPPGSGEPWKATASRALFGGGAAATWRHEHDPTSQTALDVAPTLQGTELRLRYGLAGGAATTQFAAMVVETPGGVAPFDRLNFTARAEAPLRISVQVRAAVTPQADERWQRSVYIDTESGEHTVRFDDLRPVGRTRTPLPPLAQVHSIVFAIDLTNTKPGASGRLWITRAALER